MQVSDYDIIIYTTLNLTLVIPLWGILYNVHSLTFHILTPREDINLTLFT